MHIVGALGVQYVNENCRGGRAGGAHPVRHRRERCGRELCHEDSRAARHLPDVGDCFTADPHARRLADAIAGSRYVEIECGLVPLPDQMPERLAGVVR